MPGCNNNLLIIKKKQNKMKWVTQYVLVNLSWCAAVIVVSRFGEGRGALGVHWLLWKHFDVREPLLDSLISVLFWFFFCTSCRNSLTVILTFYVHHIFTVHRKRKEKEGKKYFFIIPVLVKTLCFKDLVFNIFLCFPLILYSEACSLLSLQFVNKV